LELPGVKFTGQTNCLAFPGSFSWDRRGVLFESIPGLLAIGEEQVSQKILNRIG
jgi:hypothetical protein